MQAAEIAATVQDISPQENEKVEQELKKPAPVLQAVKKKEIVATPAGPAVVEAKSEEKSDKQEPAAADAAPPEEEKPQHKVEKVAATTKPSIKEEKETATDKEKEAEQEEETTKKCEGCDAAETSSGAFKLCAKCKQVRYCSRDCQKKHWKEHKKDCCKQQDDMNASGSHLHANIEPPQPEREHNSNSSSKSSSSNADKEQEGAKELEELLETIRNDDDSAGNNKNSNSTTTSKGNKKKDDTKEEEDPVDAARNKADKNEKEHPLPSPTVSSSSADDDNEDKETVARTCTGCDKVEENKGDFKFCAKCNVSVYCSRACQKKHWKEHKKVCCMVCAILGV
jgi:hypothetical protein